ncbi:pilus assembly protein FimV [Microvirgula aerodenitrificans]|uniref:Pilus assembly protein FimV n=1 Tax=Microvirgula aerodenitrificans TaxID=57480 RepID=A0A2S0PF84_9NEIS|nr:pilus assembly protein FimV [Microvirgula aerodenitrificans]
MLGQWWRQNRFVKASARGIDPVGEAEVFLFQGKVRHAIRVLKAALDDEPGNMSVKVVLLRAFADGNYIREYSELAREVSEPLQGEPIWQQIQRTGREMEPDNPLYHC